MGIFDFFSGKKYHTASYTSNNTGLNNTNPTSEITPSLPIVNASSTTSNDVMQDNSPLNRPLSNQNQNTTAVPKEITGNGEEIILGYGYASSYELSKRGYRDGITVQTLSDMNEGISLVLAEYQAHLDKEIQKYEDEKDTCFRILARSGNISQQFDEQYEEIIQSQQRKIAKYEVYKLEIQKPEGQAAAIVTAYKRGYQAGVGKHRLYLTDPATPNKAD